MGFGAWFWSVVGATTKVCFREFSVPRSGAVGYQEVRILPFPANGRAQEGAMGPWITGL